MYKFAFAASLLVACGSKDEAAKSEPGKPEPGKPETKPSKPRPQAPDLGSCELTVSGAVTAKIKSGGGTSKAVTSYWFTEGDKANMVFAAGKTGMIINCNNAEGSISILAYPEVTKETLPFGPKKYTLDKKLRGAELHALGTIGKTSLMMQGGTVDITAFDAKHIAGKIQLTVKTLPGNGDAKIEGTFDYKCSTFSACAK